MNEIALLVAATLASGTPLALAGLGLLLNEKAGVLNLGAEGMMLVAAVAGFAAALHDRQRHAGLRCRRRRRRAARRGVRRAGDLAQHQPVRHRAGAQPVRRRLLGLRRRRLCRPETGRPRADSHSAAVRHPARRPGAVPAAPDGLPDDRAGLRHRLVPLPQPRRSGAAVDRRIARIGACARLPRALGAARRRWSPAARCAASPAPSCRSSTRRCGSKGWSPAAAGSRWR